MGRFIVQVQGENREQEQMPENTEQEPAERLYEALRAAEMIPAAWGGWGSLLPGVQAKCRREAGHLWPDPELAEVVKPNACRHKWQSAGYDDAGAGLMLYCQRCALVQRYAPSQVPISEGGEG